MSSGLVQGIDNALRQNMREHAEYRHEIQAKRYHLRRVKFYVEDNYFMRVFTGQIARLRMQRKDRWIVSLVMFNYMFKKLPAEWRFANVEFTRSNPGTPHLSFNGVIVHPLAFKF
jgi:hypothetical protein